MCDSAGSGQLFSLLFWFPFSFPLLIESVAGSIAPAISNLFTIELPKNLVCHMNFGKEEPLR